MTATKTAVQLSAEMRALDPDSIAFRDASLLRDIVSAEEELHAAELALYDRVHAARAQGVSWAAIGAVLGITRQGARQRFRNG